MLEKDTEISFYIEYWIFYNVAYIFSLTLFHTTNFRLFQTKRLCRRKFKIWWKWQKVLQTGGKQRGKRRNCSLRAISPFPTQSFQRICSADTLNRGLFGKVLRHLLARRGLNTLTANAALESFTDRIETRSACIKRAAWSLSNTISLPVIFTDQCKLYDDDELVGFMSLRALGIYGMDHKREKIGYKEIRVQTPNSSSNRCPCFLRVPCVE